VVLMLQRLSDWTDRAARILLVPIGIGFILIVFLGVLTRYVFETPIISSVELARIGFVWAAFLGRRFALSKGSTPSSCSFLTSSPVAPRPSCCW